MENKQEKIDLLKVLALKMKIGGESKVVSANRYTKSISPLKITQNLNIWAHPNQTRLCFDYEEHDILSLSGIV